MKHTPIDRGADTSAGEWPNGHHHSVVFILAQFAPLIGGAEVRALREAQALRARGHDVCVLTLRLRRALPPTQVIEGVPVRRLGGLFVRGRLRLRFGAQWVAELALLRDLLRRKQSYDIIHLRQLSWMARPAAIAAMLTHKPLLVRLGSTGPEGATTNHKGRPPHLYAGALDPAMPALRVAARSWESGDFIALQRSQWLAGLTLHLLRRPGATWVSISSRMRSYLTESGVPPGRIVVLPNGIEPDDYAGVAAEVAARRQERQPEETVVLTVARFSYPKGLDILLHAWAQISSRQPSAQLLLVGGGPLQQQLDALARALGVSASVRFVDVVSDVRPLLAAAHIFVLPSRYEGMPNALLEAMAAGLPCVATRVSGSEDLIIDGKCGLLVPPDDPAALAQALLMLLLDPELAQKLGQAARERVEQQFNDRDIIDRLVALYDRVAAGPSRVQSGEPHEYAPWNMRMEV